MAQSFPPYTPTVHSSIVRPRSGSTRRSTGRTFATNLPYGALPAPVRLPPRPAKKPQARPRLGDREAKVLAALDKAGSALPGDLVVMEDGVQLAVTQLRRSLGMLRQYRMVTMERQGQRNLWTTVLPSE